MKARTNFPMFLMRVFRVQKNIDRDGNSFFHKTLLLHVQGATKSNKNNIAHNRRKQLNTLCISTILCCLFYIWCKDIIGNVHIHIITVRDRRRVYRFMVSQNKFVYRIVFQSAY